MSVIVWLVSLGSVTPSLFLGHVVTMRNIPPNTLPNTLPDAVTTYQQRAVCVSGLGITGSQIDTALNFIITYLTPCLVLLFCVVSVTCKKHPEHSGVSRSVVFSKDEVAKGVKRQTDLVVLMGLIYFVGWLPFHMSNVSALFGNVRSPLKFKLDHDLIVLLFAFAANAISPIVYLFKSEGFRDNMSIMVCGGRHKLVDTNDEESDRNMECDGELNQCHLQLV